MSLQSTNWQALINDAVSKGNLQQAAVFEQKRNEKIGSSEYTGQQKQTNLYSGFLNAGSDMISSLRDTAAYNSAQSAAQAQITRDWQVQQNAKAMEFSASEAAKNRDWQKMMSDTAHQREIADLRAAGLNPVLSAMGGNGAAVTSGATASGVTSSGATGQVDMSMNSALVNLLGSIYSRTTAIEAANINARTQEAVADKYNATSQIVAQIAAAASKYGSDKHFNAAIETAISALTGTKYSADKHKEGVVYSADRSYQSAKDNYNSWPGWVRENAQMAGDLINNFIKNYGSQIWWLPG